MEDGGGVPKREADGGRGCGATVPELDSKFSLIRNLGEWF
jgi:hypothetical protein